MNILGSTFEDLKIRNGCMGEGDVKDYFQIGFPLVGE